MKAITMKQPWATLLVMGATRYSVRTWRTNHRGPLALYASPKFSEHAIDLCLHPRIKPLLARAGYDYIIEVPGQAIIGTANLIDCVNIGSVNIDQFDPADPAFIFDEFYPENWAWIFSDPRPLPQPIPFKGKLGIFTVPDQLLEKGDLLPSSVRPAFDK